jgi:phosphopantothenoylcysteine decarboxylase/phosphopantothenate--cysteine ligase
MWEPEQLLAACLAHFAAGPLQGVAVTITAGPTREALDPVRFISNHSSGKMGYALAEAAAALGASVNLISGPVNRPCPAGVRRVDVESAEQMLTAVLAQPGDLFIACAAVADYRPQLVAVEKIKKQQDEMNIRLVRNPDILATVSALQPRPFCVGFAAETERLAEHARAKLQAKGLDMIAANWVGPKAEGGGFDSDLNALQVFWADGAVELPQAPKQQLAHQLLQLISNRYHESRA